MELLTTFSIQFQLLSDHVGVGPHPLHVASRSAIMSTEIGNHDQQRLRCFLGRGRVQ